jgi:uncharacterized protein YqiB (DUF1249 family)
MTLYESNFVRLGWLVSDLRAVTVRRVSRSASDCDLHLTPLELCRYTSVFRLTYEFDSDSTVLRDPDLEVRSFRGFQRHPQLSKLHTGLKRELDQRWTRNMMLNKWLEYCAERGHHF